jgi:adenine-specific DNA-methyltransferase
VAKAARTRGANNRTAGAKGYVHRDKDMAARPEIGAAPRFRAKQPAATYRYDTSLSPALDWDTNPAREVAAFLIACIEEAAALDPPHLFAERRRLAGADGAALVEIAGLQDALAALKRLQRPFLNWAGKAERLSFDVPSLPLFVHERLSTAAIIKTLEDHRKRPDQQDMFALYGDPQRPMAEQVRAYEYRDRWVNRMILGDSLAVMNSLLRFEGLGGQVQMIYVDPPYGVRFGSNFQPFVRKRDVSHGDDDDMTREPEMVQAYRDTWQLGLHSYLTYLRDRLLVARDLLTPSGSIFVQISDDNLHHVRELMDEVFGRSNYISVIPFRKKTMPLGAKHLEGICDYILFYARDIGCLKYRSLYERMSVEGDSHWNYIELGDGSRRKMTREEINNHSILPRGATPFQLVSLYPAGVNDTGLFQFKFRGKVYVPPSGNSWFTNLEGMQRLAEANRIEPYEDGSTLRYVLKLSDAPYSSLTNLWSDTSAPSDKVYVVQTNAKVVQRCMLMSTDAGDLVLDPTCGGGTTAYVAEQWGRRWITIDTSRVPLALARQRLLTATYPWFRLRDEIAGPSAGFIYARKQNRRGEEVGGVVPYVTKGSIASNEPMKELVLCDRPDADEGITRVTGPFVVEATLPTPQSLDGAATAPAAPADDPGDHIARMIEVLRRAPTLALPGNRKVTLKSIRRPGRSLSLSAEALVDHDASGAPVPLAAAIAAAHEANTGGLPLSSVPVAILFGPADGPVTAKAVLDAAKEANAKNYHHLFVIGFAITADARREIEGGEDALGLPATFVTATMDLQMGDLLKTQRSSQIFAVCGLPEIAVTRLPEPAEDGTPRWQVRLVALDVFDPVTMKTGPEAGSRSGDDVPCWMLDTHWNGLVFRADQVFFPRTSAWESLRKALRATHEDTVWDHLAGDTSAPFAAPAGTEIAVKVIDDRGNELMVTRTLGEAS